MILRDHTESAIDFLTKVGCTSMKDGQQHQQQNKKKKQKNKKKIQEWETHVHNDDQITTRCYVKCSPASFCYVFISITSKIIQYR